MTTFLLLLQCFFLVNTFCYTSSSVAVSNNAFVQFQKTFYTTAENTTGENTSFKRLFTPLVHS